jgi:2'-5' RNA ligase
VAEQRQYALVAYIRNAVGEFVEQLRGELHPAHAHLPAHITVLPPRRLKGSEADGLALVERMCQDVNPFEVTLGDVENFMPITPTVFIRVGFAAYRLRELHDRLNNEALHYDEQWPYMPHLTIVKVDTMEAATKALQTARQRWATFSEPRKVWIDELTFVRQGDDCDTWIDIAPVKLGKQLVSAK